MQASAKMGKVRGTKSAMQHVRSQEGTAYDSSRNVLNHDTEKFSGQKTLCAGRKQVNVYRSP